VHLFKRCVIVSDFSEWVSRIFAIPWEDLEIQGLETNWHDKIDKKTFYLLAICKKVVWALWNSVKFKGIKPDIFGFKLQSHLQNLYYVYKKRENLNTFLEICTFH
jgi:hypothetical protein